MTSRFEQDPNEIITHSPELRDAALGLFNLPLPTTGSPAIRRKIPHEPDATVDVIYFPTDHMLIVERIDPLLEGEVGELLVRRSCELAEVDGKVIGYARITGTLDEGGDVTSQRERVLEELVRNIMTNPSYVMPQEQTEIFDLAEVSDLFTREEHRILLDAFRDEPL